MSSVVVAVASVILEEREAPSVKTTIHRRQCSEAVEQQWSSHFSCCSAATAAQDSVCCCFVVPAAAVLEAVTAENSGTGVGVAADNVAADRSR